jgi:hypothetical protein
MKKRMAWFGSLLSLVVALPSLGDGVDHFQWSPMASPQIVNEPFAATITAMTVDNAVATNFLGTVTLQSMSASASAGAIESFDTSGWPEAAWNSVDGTVSGILSATNAHDGMYGLSDPGWYYRTDVSIGIPGDVLTCWVRPGDGRAYLGFGASASGCWSLVAAPNTSQLLLEQNSG